MLRNRVIFLALAVCSLLSLFPVIGWGDIYTYTDSKGVVHLTDRPPDSRYRLMMRTHKERGLSRAWGKSRGGSIKFDGTIREVALKYRLRPALIRAIIRVESNFDPNAVSNKGAVGLMQLMPATARQYGVINRWDPVANIQAGTRHLKGLLIKFDNDLLLSLAAYNAGEGAVKKYGNQVPPYPETQKYVAKVLEFYRKYDQSM
ncbi:MAG: lytic transglycosylase domain-containing protein [Magnetococcales bacterium]|nr:lytic transglycosylase domain-containing protein [Magnetococcales bacterium]